MSSHFAMFAILSITAIVPPAFGQDHPYARAPFGNTETLNALELQEVMEQQQVVFVPSGSTLLIVGDVKAAEVMAAVKASFGNWQGYKDLTPMPRVQQPSLSNNPSEIGYVERKSASTLLTCALRPLPEVSGDDPALEILTSILGEGFGGEGREGMKKVERLAESLLPLFRRKEMPAFDDAKLCDWIQRASALGVDLLLES